MNAAEPLTPIYQFLIGMGGGAAAELMRWFGIRHTVYQGVPEWSRSWLYWVITFVMILAGGLLVVLYVLSATPLTPFLAFHVGLTAPLLLTAVAQQAPGVGPGTTR
jgi:hypothetical protein